MKKYSLSDLSVLEERIAARIPHLPDISVVSPALNGAKLTEALRERIDQWRKKHKKEQNALNKIKVEIGKRVDEVINYK